VESEEPTAVLDELLEAGPLGGGLGQVVKEHDDLYCDIVLLLASMSQFWVAV